MAENLLALAERCERAEGPDRELDTDILIALHPGALRKACGEAFIPEKGWEPGRYSQSARAYTASLDAAMTLVDHYGVLLHLSDIGADGLPMCNIGDSVTAREFKGIGTANLALAVCAAALRARSAS